MGWNGLLVVDKPTGITSRAAVDAVARWFPKKTRIGHTGTLDPLATGVLVLCLGTATRLAEYVQRMVKTYRTGLLLGACSDTDDADGAITPVPGAAPPAPAALAAAVAGFCGKIAQIPPSHSAAKVDGQRAYKLARQGTKVELAARTVTIQRIDLCSYAWPHLELEVQCSKGTYIRSLARDLGRRLGTGALVASLRRLRVGPFTAEQGVDLTLDAAAARARLLPVEMAVVELERVVLPEDDLRRLRRGQAVKTTRSVSTAEAAIFDVGGNLAAVATVDSAEELLRPVKVLSGE